MCCLSARVSLCCRPPPTEHAVQDQCQAARRGKCLCSQFLSTHTHNTYRYTPAHTVTHTVPHAHAHTAPCVEVLTDVVAQERPQQLLPMSSAIATLLHELAHSITPHFLVRGVGPLLLASLFVLFVCLFVCLLFFERAVFGSVSVVSFLNAWFRLSLWLVCVGGSCWCWCCCFCSL